METFTIREARADDLETVTALEARAGDVGWSETQWRQELESPKSRIHVGVLGDRLVGVGVFWAVAGEAQIANLVIDLTERKKGFGRRLLKSLLDRAKREGCSNSSLEVRASNIAAVTLYGHCGFAEKGRRRGFYSNPVDDAVLMEKII